jgi:hypothetical protein
MSYDLFVNNRKELTQRIAWDATTNPDGISLLLSHFDGSVTNVRTMDLDVLVTVLDTVGWERAWLHQRFATQGAVTVQNTHGFCTAGVWYMHNGTIRNREAAGLPVDSMVLGRWIQRGTLYENLATEDFSNVFLVSPDTNVYTVVRSSGGTLFTDGNGNYSTREAGPINQEVTKGVYSYWIDEELAPDEDETETEPTVQTLDAPTEDKYHLADGTPVYTFPWNRE